MQFQMPDLLAADLSHFWPTHSASAHTGKHNTHTLVHTVTHAHAHAHAHIPTAQEMHKSIYKMHNKQALSPIHEICQFLWIPKAKKLFLSSEIK